MLKKLIIHNISKVDKNNWMLIFTYEQCDFYLKYYLSFFNGLYLGTSEIWQKYEWLNLKLM